MSKKKQQEIISLLESTIRNEQKKVGGGNADLITILSNKLNSVREWTPKE